MLALQHASEAHHYSSQRQQRRRIISMMHLQNLAASHLSGDAVQFDPGGPGSKGDPPHADGSMAA
jgi:hypothetical protein